MADDSKRRSLGVFNVDQHALEHFEFSFSETLTSHQPVRSFLLLLLADPLHTDVVMLPGCSTAVSDLDYIEEKHHLLMASY